jgi:hypothetical protein
MLIHDHDDGESYQSTTIKNAIYSKHAGTRGP